MPTMNEQDSILVAGADRLASHYLARHHADVFRLSHARRCEHCRQRGVTAGRHGLVARCFAGTERRCRACECGRPAQPRAEKFVSVDHLATGVGGHRVRIPVEVHPYWAGLYGGLAGSVAMAVVAMLFGLIAQRSIWYPINLLAAGILPFVGPPVDAHSGLLARRD